MEGVIFMTSRKMSWEEIQKKYPGTWVGLINVEWKNRATIDKAVVFCTDREKTTDEMALMTVQGELDTTCYTTPDETLNIGAVTL
jgi:hypothetical protein